jgi:uncharacterized membrane protein
VDGVILVLGIVNAMGAALSAGALFAFSSFVMDGLGRTPDEVGLTAMQGINLAAPSPLFMLALLGTAVTSAVVGVLAVARWDEPGSPWMVLGAALYLLSVAITVTYHVPRNNALAALDPATPASAAQWRRYHRDWTRMNHVRVLVALAAAVVFTLGFRLA